MERNTQFIQQIWVNVNFWHTEIEPNVVSLQAMAVLLRDSTTVIKYI